MDGGAGGVQDAGDGGLERAAQVEAGSRSAASAFAYSRAPINLSLATPTAQPSERPAQHLLVG